MKKMDKNKIVFYVTKQSILLSCFFFFNGIGQNESKWSTINLVKLKKMNLFTKSRWVILTFCNLLDFSNLNLNYTILSPKWTRTMTCPYISKLYIYIFCQCFFLFVFRLIFFLLFLIIFVCFIFFFIIGWFYFNNLFPFNCW